jgi:hypothetical protein
LSAYFTNCTTLPDLERERRRLAKLHHPDVAGGSLVVMQEINAEYERVRDRLSPPLPPPGNITYTYPCPRQQTTPVDLSALLEQMMREAREGGRRAGGKERERQRQEYRSQVDRQRQSLKEELLWALREYDKGERAGLFRGCQLHYSNQFEHFFFVGGNTYHYREWFKEHGFRWDDNKRQWYFHKKPHLNQEESEVDEDDDDYSD